MGDNPHFPVGLADVAAFGGDLAPLRGRGFQLHLSILTNRRAMTTDGLAMLRRLPVPYSVEEWTEEREGVLLDKSVACFLPVNAQNFSTVKSLNRAVSALCAGAQVLATGYPLYQCLAPFIYADAHKLLDDLNRRTLAVRDDTVQALLGLLQKWADPHGEARALAQFLETQARPKSADAYVPAGQPRAAIVHGQQTLGEVHKFSQRMQALSVASPFCSGNLNFDLRFPFADHAEGCEVLIAEKHCSLLAPAIRAQLSPHDKILATTYRKLDPSRLIPELRWEGSALGRLNSPLALVACYPRIMGNIERVLEHLFPGIRCYREEQAPLPLAGPIPRARVREAA
jgi:hypothetical protein